MCDCKAYDFPHRFGGGACNGRWIVARQWKGSRGFSGPCVKCHAAVRGEAPYCQVLEGQEKIAECPAWQEFVHRHEIRIYGIPLSHIKRARLRVAGGLT